MPEGVEGPGPVHDREFEGEQDEAALDEPAGSGIAEAGADAHQESEYGGAEMGEDAPEVDRARRDGQIHRVCDEASAGAGLIFLSVVDNHQDHDETAQQIDGVLAGGWH